MIRPSSFASASGSILPLATCGAVIFFTAARPASAFAGETSFSTTAMPRAALA